MARDKALDRILKEMSATDREAFMELSYIAIMHEPDYAVSLSHD